MKPVLVIGNYRYSSWSLRAWIHLTESGCDFDVERVAMVTDGWRERIRGLGSPTGRVPVLRDGDLVVWDTLSIFEYVLERQPGAVGWPADPAARARARSVAAEMHAGFLALRTELPQNLGRRAPVQTSDLGRRQIERVRAIWREALAESGGPWLFGGLSIADVMYAPVALRFVSYEVPLGDAERGFTERVQALPSVREWVARAAAETETIDAFDDPRAIEQP